MFIVRRNGARFAKVSERKAAKSILLMISEAAKSSSKGMPHFTASMIVSINCETTSVNLV